MFVRPFLFCFGFRSLHPHNVAPFIGTLFMTCANTNYEKNEEKPSLPLKILHIWQARIISFRQDKKKTTRWFSFFLFVIPTASSKNFASRKKTDSAHLVCVHVIRVKTQKLVGKQGAKLCLSIPLLLWFRKHPRGT